MAAVAGQLNRIARVVTVGAAVFTIGRCVAVASWVFAI
jgi:hypothetical protein